MSSNWIRVERKPEGYAVLSMCREPVNTLNKALWQQLFDVVNELEADDNVRGVVITSGLQRDIFTAGNDITALHAPTTSLEQYRDFWVLQNTCLARLYRSPLATIAAIKGACPAAGCNIAMCCDWRVMTEQGYIGLNEVAIGISVPEKWCNLMARTIGERQAEQLTLSASMPTAAEALKLGLVDQLVPKAQLLATAEAAMQKMLKLPDGGRQKTKESIRGQFSRDWEAFCHGEVDGAWEMLSSPDVVAAVGDTLKRLTGKKKAML